MRKFLVFITVLAALFTFAAVSVCAAEDSSEEFEGYTVKFTRGYSFINPLTGTESDHLFTGTIPESVTVEEGGSFIFPENTIKFADYVFVYWKYSYKDEDGNTVTEKHIPGDIYENVTGDMEIAAVWKRPDPIKLVITGYISYDKGDEYAEGTDITPYSVTCGKAVKLASCPYTKDGYDFAGWVDSDGILIQAGANYTVNKANPVLTAVWQKNGESILTHTVVYKGGEGNVSGKGPAEFEMYEKTSFKVAVNSFLREGYEFLYWENTTGGAYYPGDILDISSSGESQTVLTAVWKEITNYYDITFDIRGEGGVSPPGNATVAEGGNYSFNVTAYSGHRIKSVKVNGTEKSINTSYILENITENLTVTIIFEEIPVFSVSISCGEGGNAYTAGDVTAAAEGESVTVYLSPKDGYSVKSVHVNGKLAEYSGGVLVIENITENINISVEFTANDESASTSSTSSDSGESSPFEVETPSDMKYIYILAALVVLMSLGFIIIRIKK
ncbi:MAG: InlB B-repeat-containing protein [Eubacteriales bacterium]|nr:InlB B-repeat-containing protein [Eubacteriales bacterium]